MNLHYRFRFNVDDREIQRNELQATVGPRALNMSADYIFVDQNAGSGEFADREEITASVASQVTKAWSARASTRRDLTEDGGTLNTSVAITYRCDCFTFTATFARSFTRDRDLKPTDTVFVRLIFKTLGAFTAATQIQTPE